MQEMEFDFFQESLGEEIKMQTNADIVFVIDATASMQPLLDKVKNFALSLYDDMQAGLKQYNKEINQFRVKVIAFRDYYCDDKLAMQESNFFYLPPEAHEFRNYVASIQAKGGGDRPENSLEAIALAMKSDWVREGNSKRHAIVVFTDAPAHPLEKSKEGKPRNYPKVMFSTYGDMLDAWGTGQGTCIDMDSSFQMDRRARRLILFVPSESPWIAMEDDFEQCVRVDILADNGGRELDTFRVLDTLCKSMQ